VLLDSYLRDAIEVDVDAVADGTDVFICGVMEHIEEAGVHSGDSACSLPPHSLKSAIIAELERQTVELARALKVVGLMNVQFAIQNDDIHVLEVNPRASRTVPFVAKVIGLPVAGIAAEVMAGRKLASFELKRPHLQHIAVKEAVFPFARFPGVDTVLGPEMRSTGEVMGIDKDYAMAFAKSQLGGGCKLPLAGTVFVSVKDSDKDKVVGPIRQLAAMGFRIIATRGTKRHLDAHGIDCERVNKVLEGRPHIVDAITNGEVDIVFNTTEGAKALADSFAIRRSALLYHIPYYTTLAGALAVTEAIKALRAGNLSVTPLQNYAGRRQG
jgi:carbamoyl-phosphate synthase large subunit